MLYGIHLLVVPLAVVVVAVVVVVVVDSWFRCIDSTSSIGCFTAVCHIWCCGRHGNHSRSWDNGRDLMSRIYFVMVQVTL